LSQASPTSTVGRLLAESRRALQSVSLDPGLEAELLLADTLGRDRTWVLAHPEAGLEAEPAASFRLRLGRLLAGEPLPYVLGWWEFYGRRFHLTPDVLIPRPETELLMESALTYLVSCPDRRRAADIGSGSGCLAVSLGCEVGDLHLVATDLSREALLVAQSNARDHGVEGRIGFVQADLLGALTGPLDLVCANLPYIPTSTLLGLAVGRREPRLALDGGEDGMHLIRRLLRQLEGVLAEGAQALLEIEAGEGEAALAAAASAVPDARVQLRQDLAGHDRLLVIEREAAEA
jgi:release factor glutamine methyltransferase